MTFRMCTTLWKWLTKNNNLIHIIMELSHIEHLGIAVKSLDEAIPYYENMKKCPTRK